MLAALFLCLLCGLGVSCSEHGVTNCKYPGGQSGATVWCNTCSVLMSLCVSSTTNQCQLQYDYHMLARCCEITLSELTHFEQLEQEQEIEQEEEVEERCLRMIFTSMFS